MGNVLGSLLFSTALRSILPSIWTSSRSSPAPEGKTLEFKRDLSSPDGVLKTMVAFANTAGGTLLVGVEDALEMCVGFQMLSMLRSASRIS
jgi:predicted HTH transcriptional regulator